MGFTRVFFTNNVKIHVVPGELLEDIRDDIFVRYLANISQQYPVDNTILDHTGACFIERSWERFEVDGLEIKIPSDYALELTSQFTEPTCRELNDKTYYKFYSGVNCLILTEPQFQSFKKQYMDRLEDVSVRGNVERTRFIAVLDSLRGVPGIQIDDNVPKVNKDN